MEKINIIILLVGLGFILIGLTFLKSKSIRSSIEAMKTYKDTNKYLRFNGIVNIMAGILIIIANIIDLLLKTSYELYLVLPIIILASLITTFYNKSLKS